MCSNAMDNPEAAARRALEALAAAGFSETEDLTIYYQAQGRDGEEYVLLAKVDGDAYLLLGKDAYRLSYHPYGSDTYIYPPQGGLISIHNAFCIPDDLESFAQGKPVMTATGRTHDAAGFCRIIQAAIEGGRDEYTIEYVEGLAKGDPEDCFRVISGQIRFGCGYRMMFGQRQYYAWYGYPNRDDDFFVTTEISAEEFQQIQRDYPEPIDLDRDESSAFETAYIAGHKELLRGWNKLLH